ncbi:MAG: ATP-binding protein, partial [Chitinispirillales bacterium]|nr:ATP-binding protein [Chitinispirillales bacterium]
MIRRRLPIGGVQVFRELRRDYDVYVDKTRHVYEMASRYKTVFLARPRRFGKSLLCSTIASLFRAEKELFEGLAIAGMDWEWKVHPIIHIGFGHGDFTDNGVEALNIIIERELDSICDTYGISVKKTGDISDLFVRVITELAQKIGMPVVIIDEYDNPLLNTIDQPELNKRLREKLKGFYSVIKQYGEHIRFAFITGVTKFAQVSVFSGMNQPQDISMMAEYCDICGVTQEELENVFAPEIDSYAEKYGGREKYLDKLRGFYNGYCFTKDKISVYNTYGLLNHFENSADFTPYWSMSGIPSFLLKYLKMKSSDIVEIEEAQMKAGSFADYRDDTITLFPLLYQAGYLTITDYDERTGIYKLNYPNIEVRQTFAEFLSGNYSKSHGIFNDSLAIDFIDALLAGNVDEFMDLLKWYLQTVDYSLSSKITEFYVEFAVSNIINMLGLRCVNEVHTANGRMDSVIHAGEYIYIIEFKVDKPVEKAVRQIRRKDYALIFAREGKKIIKVGVVFNRETRNIL